LGDGSSQDDGIYVLLKEVIDNSIDEFRMGNGKQLDVAINNGSVVVRDYGRGIPLGKVIDVVSKINTGAKYDSEAFKKSVGLNGVGLKAVNALSNQFKVQSVRDGMMKSADFSRGVLVKEYPNESTKDKNGVIVTFTPDGTVFKNYHFINDYVERMLWNYAYLNTGLTLHFNGNKYFSENGLHDLLKQNINGPTLYPIIHLKGKDIEVAITHFEQQYGEEYYSFANGQYTSQGGTHQAAFREAYVKTIREFYKKDFEAVDCRTSIVAAIKVDVQEPVFESQTKTKLGSQEIAPGGQSLKAFITDFIKTALDNYLHKNPETSDLLLKKIIQSEKERKDLAGIQKLARERAKKASLHNRKLRDCRLHYNSTDERRLESTLFITEGDSASGSITKSRDVNTQAVISLKGKPLNVYGKTKKNTANL
jgi:topoisomerase-4 subunit B